AVAQYLKKQSSITPTSGNSQESSEDLSLNKILEGKPKKICARMFYETLVLKNYGLVDVHQENPYDDVSLKVTPKLSKGQYS
ncbi:UNVERIFIED_CONTAM: Sister chromatid cohesion 1 protein 3, partial [Sesamum indicum]